jgi:anti-sigma B factor antagonist
MDLDCRQDGEVTIVKVRAVRIDARVAPEFREALAARIALGNRRLVLDVSAVSFIDSSGLGAIVATLKGAGRAGDVVIAGACDAVATLFRLTRMDKVFRFTPTADAGVAALA